VSREGRSGDSTRGASRNQASPSRGSQSRSPLRTPPSPDGNRVRGGPLSQSTSLRASRPRLPPLYQQRPGTQPDASRCAMSLGGADKLQGHTQVGGQAQAMPVGGPCTFCGQLKHRGLPPLLWVLRGKGGGYMRD